MKECCSKQDENLAPSVKELFDAAKAQEFIIENIPEPPDVDEIEEKLERLKKFNKKFLNNSNAQAVSDKVKSDKTKNVKKSDKNVGTNGNDVEMIEEKKDENFFEMNENKITELCDESEHDGEFVNGTKKERKLPM